MLGADAVQLVKIIKKAATEAVDAQKPVNVFFGTVLSANPLTIDVEQKMKLGSQSLVLTQAVSDHKVTVDFGGGKQEITVFNGLVAGDKVALLRQAGGQQFIVWNKVET